MSKAPPFTHAVAEPYLPADHLRHEDLHRGKVNPTVNHAQGPRAPVAMRIIWRTILTSPLGGKLPLMNHIPENKKDWDR